MLKREDPDPETVLNEPSQIPKLFEMSPPEPKTVFQDHFLDFNDFQVRKCRKYGRQIFGKSDDSTLKHVDMQSESRKSDFLENRFSPLEDVFDTDIV